MDINTLNKGDLIQITSSYMATVEHFGRFDYERCKWRRSNRGSANGVWVDGDGGWVHRSSIIRKVVISDADDANDRL